MTWPLDLSAWVNRLDAANIPGVKTIGLAGDLQRLRDVRRALPGIWVLPSEDVATARSPEPVPTGRRRVTSRVTVVIALAHYGDSSGGKAADALQAVRSAIATSLRGWQIDLQSTPVQFAGGQASALDDAVMWWQDNYEVSSYD